MSGTENAGQGGSGSVPLAWVVLFLVLVLGAGAAAVLFLGGSVLPGVLGPLA
jgi:hypothetical protein